MKLKLTKKQKAMCDSVYTVEGRRSHTDKEIADILHEIHKEISGKIVGNFVCYNVPGGTYKAYMFVHSMRVLDKAIEPGFTLKGKTVFMRKAERKLTSYIKFDPNYSTQVYNAEEIQSLDVMSAGDFLKLLDRHDEQHHDLMYKIRETAGQNPSHHYNTGKWITNGNPDDSDDRISDQQSWGIFG